MGGVAPISFPSIVTYNCMAMLPTNSDLPSEVMDHLCGKKRVEKNILCHDESKKARVDDDVKGGQLD